MSEKKTVLIAGGVSHTLLGAAIAKTMTPTPTAPMTDEASLAAYRYLSDEGMDPNVHSGTLAYRGFMAGWKAAASPPAPSSPVGDVVREWERLTGETIMSITLVLDCGKRMAAALTAQATRIAELEGNALDWKAGAENRDARIVKWRDRANTLKLELAVSDEESLRRWNSLTAAESALTTARGALRRLAIVEVHRPAYGGGTLHVGWRCNACGCDVEMPVLGGIASSPDDIPHSPDCPLAALPAKQAEDRE